MPWREICPMDEKMRLVAAGLADEHSMSELCASLGVSRKTGYKWLLRYRAQGAAGLHELSRAPHRVPWALAEAPAQAILVLRYARNRVGGPGSCAPSSRNASRRRAGPRRARSASCCTRGG